MPKKYLGTDISVTNEDLGMQYSWQFLFAELPGCFRMKVGKWHWHGPWPSSPIEAALGAVISSASMWNTWRGTWEIHGHSEHVDGRCTLLFYIILLLCRVMPSSRQCCTDQASLVLFDWFDVWKSMLVNLIWLCVTTAVNISYLLHLLPFDMMYFVFLALGLMTSGLWPSCSSLPSFSLLFSLSNSLLRMLDPSMFGNLCQGKTLGMNGMPKKNINPTSFICTFDDYGTRLVPCSSQKCLHSPAMFGLLVWILFDSDLLSKWAHFN